MLIVEVRVYRFAGESINPSDSRILQRWYIYPAIPAKVWRARGARSSIALSASRRNGDHGAANADQRFPRGYWVYLAGVALVAARFADFPLITHHFQRTGSIAGNWILISCAIAMAVTGAGSLVFVSLCLWTSI
jgi:hypothetical protein